MNEKDQTKSSPKDQKQRTRSGKTEKQSADRVAAKPKVVKKRPVRPARKKAPSYVDLNEDPLFQELQQRFGDGVVDGKMFLGQPIYSLSMDRFMEIMVYLRDSQGWGFDYLVDLTSLDYQGDDKRFCVVYHLCSHKSGSLIRVKVRVGEGEEVPSVTPIWKSADWMEREVYDLFGVEFSGHPDLRRILLPEGWHGYPLRKDYDIKLQDQSWIREHLEIRKTPN